MAQLKSITSENVRKYPSGSLHPSWKGNDVEPHAGNLRAIKMFPLEPCENCGNNKSERHHRDGNPLNNDRNNIRFLCHRCHMIEDGRLERLHEIRRGNVPLHKPKPIPANSKTGIKGVSWNKNANKWEVRIYVRGQRKYVGTFDSTEEAAMAYEKAVKKYFRLPKVGVCE